MKTLTSAVVTEVAKDRGSEPITVLKVEWSSGTVYYADKQLTVGATTFQGRISTVDTTDLQIRKRGFGYFGAVGVNLIDDDGVLKGLINTEVLENVPCTLYQYFGGLALADLTPIFSGTTRTGVTWKEGDRDVRIDIDTVFTDGLIGYELTEDSIVGIDEDAVGQVVPMCFGKVLHVPAIHVLKAARSILSEGYTVYSDTKIYVEDLERFPEGEIIVRINDVRIRVQRSDIDGCLLVLEANLAHYSVETAFDARPFNSTQKTNVYVAWVPDSIITAGIYNRFVLIENQHGQRYTNRVVGVSGNMVTFYSPFVNFGGGIFNEGTETLVTDEWSIIEIAALPRSGWPNLINYVVQIGVDNPGVTYLPNMFRTPSKSYVARSAATITASMDQGESVVMEDSVAETYLCNYYTSYEIVGVYAFREDSITGKQLFAVVPSRYYTKYLSYAVDGYNMTALVLDEPLEYKVNEGWESDLYISLRSTVGNNTATIIKTLVEEFTSVTIDTTTFNTVAAELAAYPSNFALFEQHECLDVCADIAWQARCGLIFRDGKLYIVYLSKSRTAVMTFGYDTTEEKSVDFGITGTNDLITEMTAKWRRYYASLDGSYRLNNYAYHKPVTYSRGVKHTGGITWVETPTKYVEPDYEIIYKRNVDEFGLFEEEVDFFIYNIESLVKKSTYFWGYRLANIWRTISGYHFLDALKLEPWDQASYAISDISTNTLKGEVQEIDHNSADSQIKITTTLASLTGQTDGNGQPEDGEDYWYGDPDVDPDDIVSDDDTPPDDDPFDDVEERDYIVPTDTDLDDDEEEEPEPDEDTDIYLKITACPDIWVRGVEYTIEAELVDSSLGSVNQSMRVYIDLLDATDGADGIFPQSGALDKTYFDMQHGFGGLTTAKIEGGTGNDTVKLVFSGDFVNTPLTRAISIIDVAIVPVFDDYPTAVVRCADFTISVKKRTGTHDGGDDATFFTDSAATFPLGLFVGAKIHNDTSGASALITDNTETTITHTALTGGSRADWDDGDTCTIDVQLPANATINIALVTSSGEDKLYQNDVLISTITTDANGEFEETDFHIGGGVLNDFGHIQLTDPLRRFETIFGETFEITGVCDMLLEQEVVLGDEFIGGPYAVQFLATGDFADPVGNPTEPITQNQEFYMSLALVDHEETVVAAFNGSAKLSLLDEAGNPYFQWIFVPDGNISANTVDITMVAGEYETVGTGARLRVGWPNLPTRPFYVRVEIPEYGIDSRFLINILVPYFQLSGADTITRGVAYALTIQAKNSDGSNWTDYTPTTDGALSLYERADALDVLTPLIMESGDWVSGAQTISITVSGGTTAGAMTIRASNQNDRMIGDLTVYVGGSVTTVESDHYLGTYISGYFLGDGTQSGSVEETIRANILPTLESGLSLLKADTSRSAGIGTGTHSLYGYITKGTPNWNQVAGFQVTIGRFTIPSFSNLIEARINVMASKISPPAGYTLNPPGRVSLIFGWSLSAPANGDEAITKIRRNTLGYANYPTVSAAAQELIASLVIPETVLEAAEGSVLYLLTMTDVPILAIVGHLEASFPMSAGEQVRYWIGAQLYQNVTNRTKLKIITEA